MHSNAVCLNNSSWTIDINYQSRQVITFAMYKPIHVVLLIVCDADADASIQSHLQTPLPERSIDGFVNERQHSHGNGTYLPMTNGNEITFP